MKMIVASTFLRLATLVSFNIVTDSRRRTDSRGGDGNIVYKMWMNSASLHSCYIIYHFFRNQERKFDQLR